MNNYHKWTKNEEDIFREAIILYQFNLEAIQSKFLPHISLKSMKNKYYQRIHNNADIKIQIKNLKQQNLQYQFEGRSEQEVYNYIRNLINE
ncbi:Myb-like_DNA-binding domain-containing protein [Hexamita inflata]|uniref:Myb-like DNA-binding domain-containing protein n=1 Tax=Hexamita inflata TaxID=28002 RepID=A0AA86Q3U5_9EUKA|nr:Myb-like DNA-binding domain-containing protein [Hexamita inflata]CAI9945875.1 Myb-like DNA-binding domain-containing protein [Hexamita inflata]